MTVPARLFSIGQDKPLNRQLLFYRGSIDDLTETGISLKAVVRNTLPSTAFEKNLRPQKQRQPECAIPVQRRSSRLTIYMFGNGIVTVLGDDNQIPNRDIRKIYGLSY